MDDPPKKRITEFDDMLQLVGSWGRFQVMLMVMFFPFNLFLGYVYLSSVLINYTPPHWCKVEELLSTNLTMEQRKYLSVPLEEDLEYSKCAVYAPDWNQVISEGYTEPDPNWPKVPCSSGWEYDLEHFHRSSVTDFDWVCDRSWIPSLGQAMFFAGAIPGTLVFGYISDTFGRIPATVASNTIAMLSGILTTFSVNHWNFFCLRFLTGACHNMFFTIPYILSLEYVDKSKRTLVGNLGLALFLTISGVSQPWLIKYIGDWKMFSWIIFGQMSIVFALPWIMPESSRWLQSQGQSDKAVQIMRKIAKINRRKVSEESFKSYKELCDKQKESESSGQKSTFIDLFRHRNLRKNVILVVILFMIITCVFDSTVRNVTNMKFSIYLTFMISVALELPADLLSIVGISHLGRRFSASVSLGLCGLCLLLAVPLSDYPIIAATFAFTGRFFATYALNTGFQYTVEVMPTSLRGQGAALSNISSMVAQIASPYIVYSSNLNPNLPFILMGILGLVGILPGLFLPETADTQLPDSIEDAEARGLNDRFFWIPLMGSENRYKTKKNSTSGVENPAFVET